MAPSGGTASAGRAGRREVALRAVSPAPLGFVAGARAFFAGLRFVVVTPSLWPWALVPLVVTTTLATGLGAAGVWGALKLAAMIGPHGVDALSAALLWVLRVSLGLLAVAVAVVVALSLAEPLSSFALDAIGKKQHAAIGGRPIPDPGAWASFLRSVRVALVGLGIALPLLAVLAIIELLFAPAAVVTIPLGFVVSALLLAWNFLDYPLGQRRFGVRARMRWFGENFRAVLGFGAACGVVLLVPFAQVLVLPFGVAGATRLAHEIESRRPPPDPLLPSGSF